MRYWKFLKVLKDRGDPQWNGIFKPSIITGMKDWDKSNGPIGSNVNKGYEIYICLDGDDVNSAMYIMIHELAHMTVPEYDHTALFWSKFDDLKAIAVSSGVYTIGGDRKYCGDTIQES